MRQRGTESHRAVVSVLDEFSTGGSARTCPGLTTAQPHIIISLAQAKACGRLNACSLFKRLLAPQAREIPENPPGFSFLLSQNNQHSGPSDSLGWAGVRHRALLANDLQLFFVWCVKITASLTAWARWIDIDQVFPICAPRSCWCDPQRVLPRTQAPK